MNLVPITTDDFSKPKELFKLDTSRTAGVWGLRDWNTGRIAPCLFLNEKVYCGQVEGAAKERCVVRQYFLADDEEEYFVYVVWANRNYNRHLALVTGMSETPFFLEGSVLVIKMCKKSSHDSDLHEMRQLNK